MSDVITAASSATTTHPVGAKTALNDARPSTDPGKGKRGPKPKAAEIVETETYWAGSKLNGKITIAEQYRDEIDALVKCAPSGATFYTVKEWKVNSSPNPAGGASLTKEPVA